MENKETFSFSSILPVIKKRFVWLLLAAAVSGGAAAFLSGEQFIKPRFKSYSIVYPSNISPYSDESETEQLMQLMEASAIRDTLVSKFHLYKRYNIQEGGKASQFYLIEEFNERVKVDKTRFESVEVSVMDEDPEIAKQMVETILTETNKNILAIHKSKSLEVVNLRQGVIAALQEQVDAIESKLKFLTVEKGVINVEMQTKELTQGYARLVAANKIKQANDLKNQLENIKEVGTEFQQLSDLKMSIAEEMGNERRLLAQEKGLVIKQFSFLNEVVKPYASDKKAYPVRWLILFSAVASTVLLTIIIFLILDRDVTKQTAA